MEVLHLVKVSVTDIGLPEILGTEWIFFGLPTKKKNATERIYTQYDLTDLKGRLKLIVELRALEI